MKSFKTMVAPPYLSLNEFSGGKKNDNEKNTGLTSGCEVKDVF